MAITKLTTSDDFQRIKKENAQFILFKNSTTCPISAQAFEEFEKFSDDVSREVYYLNVQESRPLSTEIAETYGVKHQSPQALVFNGEEVVWNDSHWRITYTSLTEAAEQFLK
ncbi:bacillithiol system redox-active protein YtxJ [Bacillus sp. RAR_GA_16]|uniref:bacillithiol system redox-active protein YtxJ n=1 Tax=Bacillus sp. RAR_GA_16 TaxID=2876774 RepID=UPI001CCAADF3|nr:bacillithiol system redox-active protein YtxJ [Bacillus sp. RAR_GA_16]MCA0171549.1 bacillithiol system redox-active protein YtxJ [Bacillus sp. RAR_GA_16]